MYTSPNNRFCRFNYVTSLHSRRNNYPRRVRETSTASLKQTKKKKKFPKMYLRVSEPKSEIRAMDPVSNSVYNVKKIVELTDRRRARTTSKREFPCSARAQVREPCGLCTLYTYRLTCTVHQLCSYCSMLSLTNARFLCLNNQTYFPMRELRG